jgi:HEAT repeat protein
MGDDTTKNVAASFWAKRRVKICSLVALILLLFAFDSSAQTLELSVERKIEILTERLKSNDTETRRDAVHQLRVLENAVASGIAARFLTDKAEIVRATAAEAVIFLPTEEAVRLLLPLLKDKSEFVRREACSALGEAGGKTATPDLIRVLVTDKEIIVRAAAAIALGEIADERAVESLSTVLISPKPRKKELIDVDDFLRRSTARSLGRIRDKRGVLALSAALRDTKNSDDVRRESAFALGLIADKSAAEVLRENLNAADYLLAEIAANALQRINSTTDEYR